MYSYVHHIIHKGSELEITSLTREGVNCYILKMEYYKAIKKRILFLPPTLWINHADIFLNELIQIKMSTTT